MRLADEYGVGVVAVDNAFHYLWGGGYVIDAARKGYIAYTCCTAALAEVVPFGGQVPDARHQPALVGLPDARTRSASRSASTGRPASSRWAACSSSPARASSSSPAGRVDKDGNPTTDPNKVTALFPFGEHKGYGLALIDELMAAFIGGSLADAPQPLGHRARPTRSARRRSSSSASAPTRSTAATSPRAARSRRT